MHHTSMGVLSATVSLTAGDQGHIRMQNAPHFSAPKATIRITEYNNECQKDT